MKAGPQIHEKGMEVDSTQRKYDRETQERSSINSKKQSLEPKLTPIGGIGSRNDHLRAMHRRKRPFIYRTTRQLLKGHFEWSRKAPNKPIPWECGRLGQRKARGERRFFTRSRERRGFQAGKKGEAGRNGRRRALTVECRSEGYGSEGWISGGDRSERFRAPLYPPPPLLLLLLLWVWEKRGWGCACAFAFAFALLASDKETVGKNNIIMEVMRWAPVGTPIAYRVWNTWDCDAVTSPMAPSLTAATPLGPLSIVHE